MSARSSITAAATPRWSGELAALLTPPRLRGEEILDREDVDPRVVRRALPVAPRVTYRRGFRVTASWEPSRA